MLFGPYAQKTEVILNYVSIKAVREGYSRQTHRLIDLRYAGSDALYYPLDSLRIELAGLSLKRCTFRTYESALTREDHDAVHIAVI